jgi:hypothetical protein
MSDSPLIAPVETSTCPASTGTALGTKSPGDGLGTANAEKQKTIDKGPPALVSPVSAPNPITFSGAYYEQK